MSSASTNTSPSNRARTRRRAHCRSGLRPAFVTSGQCVTVQHRFTIPSTPTGHPSRRHGREGHFLAGLLGREQGPWRQGRIAGPIEANDCGVGASPVEYPTVPSR